jgi:hypothetical protein
MASIRRRPVVEYGWRFYRQRGSGQSEDCCFLREYCEVVYLVEKNRLPASAYDDLKNALSDPIHVLKEAPFTVEVVDAMRLIPRYECLKWPTELWQPLRSISECR